MMKKAGMILGCVGLLACAGGSDDGESVEGTETPVTESMGANPDMVASMGEAMGGTPGAPQPPMPPSGPTTPTPPTPPGPPVVTGNEPECIEAFTRLAECYLTQDQCNDAAVENADSLGQALSPNCGPLVEQAGSLEVFAAALNASTPCDDQLITAALPQLDMIEAIVALCEAAPFDSSQCGTVCAESVSPCAEGFADPGVAQFLADPDQCTSVCSMQPELGTVFSCAQEGGAECSAVHACFEGLTAGG